MSEDNVKVAVRVRPFNGREVERNAKCIIKMEGNSTSISNPNEPESDPKSFAFDFSYWSHDGFDTRADGVMVPNGAKYADQQKVFDDLGRGVLANAFAGFNTSLFAYGQTGSGKSYSMVGYGSNKGIVPLACDALFSTIEANKEGGVAVRYNVVLSMLEIYNEQVRDLLAKDLSIKGLPVRQDTDKGRFYVPALKKVAVFSYADIERRINEGTSNRTVAATKMNATSSRAHTVVTILFEQTAKNDEGKDTTKSSEINLVDLAGSERADSTGATGDRLKEGSKINQSLSCLGNVISALAELSGNPKRKIVVPYRDSVLTKLLQNSLGGNSKTIMIAALSPADINYDETLSTLRYADRAKQIKNSAKVNESATDKLIRSLKEENEKLRKMLESGGVVEVKAGMSEEEVANMRRQLQEEIRAQMEQNARAIRADEGGSQEEDKQQAAERQQESQEDLAKKQKLATVPHLVNLNEDPMLSNVVFHFLEKSTIVVGKSDDSSTPDIPLSGLNIRKDHAIITVTAKGAKIKPGNSIAKTKVNGAPLVGEVELTHRDRILFGSNHMYIYVDPRQAKQPPKAGVPENITWDFAQNEIAKAKGFQTDHNGLTQDQLRTQEQVLELLPLLSEVNAVCEEMSKHRSFEIALLSGLARGERSKDATTLVLVKVRNTLNGNEWLWPREKFMDRRYLFQTHYQDWAESDYNAKFTGPPTAGDPFYEPAEDILVGTSNAFLQSLSFAMEFQDTISIIDYRGEEQGRVRVNVTPCDANGVTLNEDLMVEDPSELLDKPFHFTITIVSVDINKVRFSKGISVKYDVFGQTEAVATPVLRGLNVMFNHTKQFSFKKVTPELLEWFENGCLTLRFFATQEEQDDVQLARAAARRTSSVGLGQTVTALGSLGRASTMVADAAVAKQLLPEGPAKHEAQAAAAGGGGALAESAELRAAFAAKENDYEIRVAELAARVAELEGMLDKRHTPPATAANAAAAAVLTPGSDRLQVRVEQLEKELQQGNLKYVNREKRLHQVLDLWFHKPAEEQTFNGLHSAVSQVVNAPDRFRRVASTVGMTQAAYSSLKQLQVNTNASASASTQPSAAHTSSAGKAAGSTAPAPAQAMGEPPKSKACVIQ